MWNHFLCRNIR